MQYTWQLTLVLVPVYFTTLSLMLYLLLEASLLPGELSLTPGELLTYSQKHWPPISGTGIVLCFAETPTPDSSPERHC